MIKFKILLLISAINFTLMIVTKELQHAYLCILFLGLTIFLPFMEE